jgi:hypothetical protein
MEVFQSGMKSSPHGDGFPRRYLGFTVRCGKGSDGFAGFSKRSIDFSIECDGFTKEVRRRLAPPLEPIQSV